MRLIDADALFEKMNHRKEFVGRPSDPVCLVEDAPTIDALALLKEQEAVIPVKQIEQTEWTVCGNCRNHIISKWIFCPYCGRSVKWE